MTTTTFTTTRRRRQARMNHDSRYMVTTLVVLMIGLTTNQVQAQQPANLEGWSDAYRTEYSYDALHSNGPDKWDSVKSTETGWGEWEAVRLTAGAATFDNTKQPNNAATTATGGSALLSWDASTPNQCGQESHPSPIELLPLADTCTDTEELKARQFNSQLDCRHPLELATPQEDATAPWELTPYSLRYYLPRTDKTCRRPTVRLNGVLANLGGNSKEDIEEHFVLLWVELHARSEHVINGKRYDAELQMVHMGTTRPDELVIVSVLIDASQSVEDNLEFQRYLLDGWQRKSILEADTCQRRRTLVGEEGAQDGRRHLRGDLRQVSGYMAALQEYWQGHNATMTAAMIEEDALEREERRKLQGNKNKCTPDAYGNGCQVYGIGPRRRVFPYNLWPGIWYYSYEGSLTAPPCTGKVNWRIIDTPLYVLASEWTLFLLAYS